MNDPRVMEAISVLLGLNLDMSSVYEEQARAEKTRREAEERAKEEARRAELERQKQEEERKRQEQLEAEARLPPEERKALEDKRRAQTIKDEGNELFKNRKVGSPAPIRPHLPLPPQRFSFVLEK